MRIMRLAASACLLLCAVVGIEGQSPFAGRWNLTGTDRHEDRIYWLEVQEQAGTLKGMFLNRGGSPVPPREIKVENGELIFRLAGPPDKPTTEFRGRVEGGRLVGRALHPDGTVVNWIGTRPPRWAAADANASHTFGPPVSVFNGISLDNWRFQHTDRPSGWAVADGVMSNEAKATNLVSKDTFRDFRIDAEYKLEKGSNSGIYLRGRYELQVLDDHGQPAESHGHMSLYAWAAPRVNASRPAGEWQVMQATIVGNRVTVTLNGQKVHDNTVIQAITGGALDAEEMAPGPIMIQGDHGKVWFRKLIVTPIK
jgi:hypothetical protein